MTKRGLHVTDRPTAKRRHLNFKLQAWLYVPQKVEPLCPLARRRPPNQYIHPRGVRPLCTVCDGHKRDLSRPKLRCERPAAAFFHARPARVPSTSRRSARRCAAWPPARHAERSGGPRAGCAARSGSTRGRPRWSGRAGPRRFDDPTRAISITEQENGRRRTA
jgi:hypothetical protein